MRGEHNFSTLMTKVVGWLFAQLCLTKALFRALIIEKTRGSGELVIMLHSQNNA